LGSTLFMRDSISSAVGATISNDIDFSRTAGA
jgi:hypothetical protein